MNSLADDLGKSLSKNIIPVSVEFLENGIDELISNNVLRDVPVLNSISAVIRIGKDLHERNLLKQTSAFLSEFNSGTIDEGKLQKYKEKLEDGEKKISELERVLLILNNNIDVEKSKYLARLFAAYVDEKITWDEFCEYTDITNRLFMEDFRLMKNFQDKGYFVEKSNDRYRLERLIAVGIIGNNIETLNGNSSIPQRKILNLIGRKYVNIIFEEKI